MTVFPLALVALCFASLLSRYLPVFLRRIGIGWMWVSGQAGFGRFIDFLAFPH
jgi:hypothetical protein